MIVDIGSINSHFGMKQIPIGMRKSLAYQSRMSYVIFSGEFSRFPYELENCDQTSQAHASQKDHKNPTDIGEAQLVGFAHPVIFSLEEKKPTVCK